MLLKNKSIAHNYFFCFALNFKEIKTSSNPLFHIIFIFTMMFTFFQPNQQNQFQDQIKKKRPFFKPHAKFSQEEDEQLRQLVEKYGENAWLSISNEMNGRSSRQCRERWLNYLSPRLNNGEWTEEEDSILLEKQKELGTSWTRISKFLPGRTDQMCKNRFLMLQRKMNKKPYTRRTPQQTFLNQQMINPLIPQIIPMNNGFIGVPIIAVPNYNFVPNYMNFNVSTSTSSPTSSSTMKSMETQQNHQNNYSNSSSSNQSNVSSPIEFSYETSPIESEIETSTTDSETIDDELEFNKNPIEDPFFLAADNEFGFINDIPLDDYLTVETF